jgi:hypothetical protein
MIKQSRRAVKQRLDSSLLIKQILGFVVQIYAKVAACAAKVYSVFMRRRCGGTGDQSKQTCLTPRYRTFQPGDTNECPRPAAGTARARGKTRIA